MSQLGIAKSSVAVPSKGTGGGSSTFGYGGDGSDGAAVFDGTSTILGLAPVSSAYTLTRDIFCTSVTVNSGVTINTANWVIYCTVSFNNAGTIQSVAGTGSNGTTGGGQTNAGTSVPLAHYAASMAGTNGGPGKAGTTGAGAAPTPVAGTASAAAPITGGTTVNGQSGAAGGSGTSGSGGAAGAGGTSGAITLAKQIARTVFAAQYGTYMNSGAVVPYTGVSAPIGSNSGGSSGAGDGTNLGGSGGSAGGGGATGGTIGIFASTITNSGTIQSVGGNGGNGGNGGTPATGNCGGGGGGCGGNGGNGGNIFLVYRTLNNTGTIQAIGGNPGTPGTGGSGVGSGTAGSNGNVGLTGLVGAVIEIQIV